MLHFWPTWRNKSAKSHRWWETASPPDRHLLQLDHRHKVYFEHSDVWSCTEVCPTNTRSQSDGQTGSGSASRWCSGSVSRRSELHDSVLVTVCNPWISEVCSHLIRYVTISVEFLISCRIWITGRHVFIYLQNIFLFFVFSFCNRNMFQPFYESQLHHFYNSLSWAVFYQSLLKSIKLWGDDAIFVFLFFLSFFLWLLVAGDHGNLHFHYKKCRLNYLWAGFYLWLKNKYCMTQKWL